MQGLGDKYLVTTCTIGGNATCTTASMVWGSKNPPNPPDQLRDLVHLIHEGAAADKSIGCTQELYDLNKSDIDVTWTYLDYLHGSCSAPGDFISLHCPLNADTKHLINKEHWCKSVS